MRHLCLIAAAFCGGGLLSYWRYSGGLDKSSSGYVSESKDSVLAKLKSLRAAPSKRVVLVTGAAGFIGFHTSLQLHHEGDTVIGIDNVILIFNFRNVLVGFR